MSVRNCPIFQKNRGEEEDGENRQMLSVLLFKQTQRKKEKNRSFVIYPWDLIKIYKFNTVGNMLSHLEVKIIDNNRSNNKNKKKRKKSNNSDNALQIKLTFG